MKTGPEHKPQRAVDAALNYRAARAIIDKSSRQVADLVEETAGGKVLVYGEADSRGSRATRTEIELDSGTKVVIHKNTGNAEGMFAYAVRFNEVEIISGKGETQTLTIKTDPETSAFNPIYVFYNGEIEIGRGYGQRLDLVLAQHLTGVNINGTDGNAVQENVLSWIKTRT